MDKRNLDQMIVEMLDAAKADCAANGIEMTTLGGILMNNGAFFEDLEDSNNCTIRTYRKVMKRLDERKARASVPKRSSDVDAVQRGRTE
jgi:hypothetical protein